MTDTKILESLQAILNDIHNPQTGIFRNFDQETRKQMLVDIAHNKSIPERDARFSLSGKDIYEQKLGDLVSCTGMTKVFLYAARNSGLDLKAVITTEIDCFRLLSTSSACFVSL